MIRQKKLIVGEIQKCLQHILFVLKITYLLILINKWDEHSFTLQFKCIWRPISLIIEIKTTNNKIPSANATELNHNCFQRCRTISTPVKLLILNEFISHIYIMRFIKIYIQVNVVRIVCYSLLYGTARNFMVHELRATIYANCLR